MPKKVTSRKTKTLKTPLWKKKFFVPLVVFVLIFGGWGVWKLAFSGASPSGQFESGSNGSSCSSVSTPVYATGCLRWYNEGGGKYTAAVKSALGELCMASDFYRYETGGWGSSPSEGYHGYVEMETASGWKQIAKSQKWQYNGNRDHQCFKVEA